MGKVAWLINITAEGFMASYNASGFQLETITFVDTNVVCE